MSHSLITQIAEVQREIKMRRQVYATRVSKRSMRQSEADYLIDVMQSVANTLLWLAEHEATIKKHLAEKGADE